MKMKRIINTLVILAVSMLTFSCQEAVELEVTMNESIVLDLSSGLTKAADTPTESSVGHLDVFIFKALKQSDDTYAYGERAYYGRYDVNNSPSVTLNAKRSSFSQDDRFFVHLIANTNLSQTQMDALATYNELQNAMQEDEYLHLTGLNLPNAPESFLMDAIAKDALGNSPVQLYNGVVSENTELNAELRRAAAKVVINITAGADVKFHHFAGDPESDGGLYYVRNLPYDTYLLSGVDASLIEAKRKTTMKGSSVYFTWHPETSDDEVSLTAYVYPHHWTNASILTDETCVIMNLPMVFKPGTAEEVQYKNSWYKIPMSKNQKFERNNYYEVNITLNRPGAISDSNPQVLTDIHYAVEDWTSQEIQVGGEDRPKYLQLNTDHVDMYNVNEDSGSLTFASSSPIEEIRLTEAYYYNSRDEKINLSSSDNNVYKAIKATAQANVLNGGITIFSPFVEEGSIENSHKNTIRYMTFEVENADGNVAVFTVAQSPTLYITNVHGAYSYRDDFKNGYSYPYYNLAAWNASGGGGSWTITRQTGSSANAFFASKRVSSSNGNNFTITYATWNNNGTISSRGSSLSGFNNPRMYHVHITATSAEYIVARPSLDENGYTESTLENSKLVSPSFLIASQLGATDISGTTSDRSGNQIRKAREHCAQYVEVSQDGVVYDDWRLPTSEEIDIIAIHQQSSDAMATVLTGSYYYCSYNTTSGGQPIYYKDVTAYGGSSGAYHVRCVHDSY